MSRTIAQSNLQISVDSISVYYCDLGAALNKTNNGSLACLALEEFRRQFSELSNREKICSPHDSTNKSSAPYCDNSTSRGKQHA